MMNYFRDQIIVTDVDNVLLNWCGGIEQYALDTLGVGFDDEDRDVRMAHYSMADRFGLTEQAGKELTKSYGMSLYMRHLSPIDNSVKYVRKLYEEFGVKFHCITAIGTHPFIKKARIENLNEVYGAEVFHAIDFVNEHDTKEQYLKRYTGTNCIFIDDVIENVQLGESFGLDGLLYLRTHNLPHIKPERSYDTVESWQDIYNHYAHGPR